MNSQSLVCLGTSMDYGTGDSVPTLIYCALVDKQGDGITTEMSDINFFVYPSARLGFTNIYTYFQCLSAGREGNLEQGLQICLRTLLHTDTDWIILDETLLFFFVD